MYLKEAFRLQNSLKVLVNEVARLMNNRYFTKRTEIYKKSEANVYTPGVETFVDEEKDVSDKNYNRYDIRVLSRALKYLIDARCQLSTGINLAKSKININGEDYDTAILRANSIRFTSGARDSLAISDALSEVELNKNIPVVVNNGDRGASTINAPYTLIVRAEIDQNVIDYIKASDKEYTVLSDDISAKIEAAVVSTKVNDKYVPELVNSLTTIEELLENFTNKAQLD